jgi:hypothetical protein
MSEEEGGEGRPLLEKEDEITGSRGWRRETKRGDQQTLERNNQ